MRQQYTTLEDHLALLKERGFTEQNMHLRGRPGKIDEAVKLAHLQCQQESRQTGMDSERAFTMQAKPDGYTSPMDVRLIYGHEARTGAFVLRKIALKLNSAMITLVSPDPRDLKMMNALYDQLKSLNLFKVKTALTIHPETPGVHKQRI